MEIIQKNDKQVLCLREYEIAEGITVPVFQFPLLEETGLVKHGFTTRRGGVSQGIFSNMNLSFTRGDDEAAVQENFRRAAAAIGITCESIVCSDQTHTTNVLKVTKEDAGSGVIRKRSYADIDGMITNEPGVTLATFYADCVPLYFVDPVHHAIGLSHSGWKGTVARMGKVTIEAMQKEFGTKPEDLFCAIGPSICQDCYEVSADVAEAFLAEFAGFKDQILIKKSEEKYQLDLWKTNEIILVEAGVLPEKLAVTNICTCCNPNLLFSHRASHGQRGNLGAFLALKEQEEKEAAVKDIHETGNEREKLK